MVFVVVYCNALSLPGPSGRLNWVRHSSHKSGATHPCQCVQYFCVCRQCCGWQCLGFLTCAHRRRCMRLHTGGCTDTVRQSALKADSGRKIPCVAWFKQARIYSKQNKDSVNPYVLINKLSAYSVIGSEFIQLEKEKKTKEKNVWRTILPN